MDCSACHAEMRIVKSITAVENDDSPDMQTRVYTVQQLKCMNPMCRNPQTAEQRHLIYPTMNAPESAPTEEQTDETPATEPSVE